MNISTQQKRLTDTENRLWLPRGRAWLGGGLGVGISRGKRLLIYTEDTNNKGLLYSTGNYIQYPMINIMEKR